MRPLLLVLFLMVSASPALAKDERCTLTTNPAVRGMYLGMIRSSTERLFREFPVPQADATGYARGTIFPKMFLIWTNAEGVSSVELAFMDSRLATILIRYDGSVFWNHSKDFARQVAQSLNLPDAWETRKIVEFETSGYTHVMRCNGFSIAAATDQGGMGKLMFVKNGIEETRHARREEMQKQKERGFKP